MPRYRAKDQCYGFRNKLWHAGELVEIAEGEEFPEDHFELAGNVEGMSRTAYTPTISMMASSDGVAQMMNRASDQQQEDVSAPQPTVTAQAGTPGATTESGAPEHKGVISKILHRDHGSTGKQKKAR